MHGARLGHNYTFFAAKADHKQPDKNRKKPLIFGRHD